METEPSQELTKSEGFMELQDWSCLEVKGSDRAKFLHNMCTNDVLGLQSGQGCEAFFTNVKGHILAHVLITCRENSLVLTRSAPQVDDLRSHLDRYIIREDVQLHDRSGEIRYVAIFGEDAEEKLAPRTTPSKLQRASLWHSCVALGGADCQLIRFPTDLPIWLLEYPQSAEQQVIDQLVARGMEHCSRQTWEALRIEAGFPLDRVDITEQNLPQEIARDARAINFKKGCYLGQETVARIDALGHVNLKLVGLKFSGNHVPAPDTPLLAEGKQVGRVTSACHSQREGAPLALAYVRRGFDVAGKRLESEFGEAEINSERGH